MSSIDGGGRRSRTATELRRFGFVMTAACVVFGSLLLWRGRAAAPYLLGLAVVFAVPALVRPTLLRPLERAWMAFADTLSAVMTRVILTLAFFLVITPLGVAMRLFGKDLLGLRLDRAVASYWIPVEPDGPASRPDKPF